MFRRSALFRCLTLGLVVFYAWLTVSLTGGRVFAFVDHLLSHRDNGGAFGRSCETRSHIPHFREAQKTILDLLPLDSSRIAQTTTVMELSSPVPFVALTLRLLTNARGDLLLTPFPVADQTRPAPSPMVFPQIADGGGYETELILLGPIGASTSVIRFFDEQGKALPAGRVPF